MRAANGTPHQLRPEVLASAVDRVGEDMACVGTALVGWLQA